MRFVVYVGQVLEVERRIHLGGTDAGMPQHVLHRPQVARRLQHVRGKRVAQLKRMYKLQGDLNALLALQEGEVQALEGALSEAGIEPR